MGCRCTIVASNTLASTTRSRSDPAGRSKTTHSFVPVVRRRSQLESPSANRRAAGTRAGEVRREALLADAHADAEKLRADGDAVARQLTQRVATERDRLADEFTALLVEEP